MVNIILGFFNLIPIPPLDGSKILFNVLPPRLISERIIKNIEFFSLPILIIFIYYIWPLIFPAIGFIFNLLTGSSGSF